jgi:hypothetical protein
MGDEDEIHLHVTYASHWDMDDAFCARMRMAIEAGLETAPIGVVTTPGTSNPKYVPTKHPYRRVSPLVDMDV